MTDSPLLALAAGNPMTAAEARRTATDMARATHQATVADIAAYDAGTPVGDWDDAKRNAFYTTVDLLALWLEAPAEGGQRGPYWLERAAYHCPPGPRCEVLHEAAVFVRMAERAEAAQRGTLVRHDAPVLRPF